MRMRVLDFSCMHVYSRMYVCSYYIYMLAQECNYNECHSIAMRAALLFFFIRV